MADVYQVIRAEVLDPATPAEEAPALITHMLHLQVAARLLPLRPLLSHPCSELLAGRWGAARERRIPRRSAQCMLMAHAWRAAVQVEGLEAAASTDPVALYLQVGAVLLALQPLHVY